MFRQFLRLQLLGALGLSTAGVPMILNGQPFLLFAKLKFLIGDGDGLRMAWDWKGANALKPCFRHSNVVSKGSDLASRNSSFVEITCADPTRFQPATSAEISMHVDMLLEAQSRVTAGALSKARFADLQKVCGLNCSPNGVLADLELRQHIDAVNVTTVDWLHTTMQDGTVTIETFLFVSSCEELGVTTMADLEAYMKSNWQFPAAFRQKGRLLYHVFDACRTPAHDKIKCTATEMLGVYGLLRHFVQTRICDRHEIADHRSSFEAACKTLDIIKSAKQQILLLSLVAGLSIFLLSYWILPTFIDSNYHLFSSRFFSITRKPTDDAALWHEPFSPN